MKYAVSEEGTEALRTMASAVVEAVEEAKRLTSDIMNKADEHKHTIGPHSAPFYFALGKINESLAQVSEPAESIAEILNKLANAYEEILSSDPFDNK